jgi:hypothetical protein
MSAQHSRRRSRRLALLLDLDPAAGRTPAERLGLELRARANASGRCVCGAVSRDVSGVHLGCTDARTCPAWE